MNASARPAPTSTTEHARTQVRSRRGGTSRLTGSDRAQPGEAPAARAVAARLGDAQSAAQLRRRQGGEAGSRMSRTGLAHGNRHR
jgi:hypothetical protein